MGKITTTSARARRPGKAASRRTRMVSAPSGPAAGSARRTPRPTLDPTAAQKLRYRFDNALAKGPTVVIGWLAALTLAISVIAGLLVWACQLDGVNGNGPVSNPAEGIWQAMLRVLDAGTFAGDTSWPMRLLAFVVTLAGISSPAASSA